MRSLPRDYRTRTVSGMSGAVQRNEVVYMLYIGAVCKAEAGRNRLLQDPESEHFVSGAGCDGVVHRP